MAPTGIMIGVRRLAHRLASLRALLLFAVEIGTFSVAGVFAFLLRFDFTIPHIYVLVLGIGLLVWVPVKCAAFAVFGLHRRWWRYVSIHDLKRLVYANLLGSAISFCLLRLEVPAFPRSAYAIDLILSLLLTASARLAVRLLIDSSKPQSAKADTKKTIIYGAGDAGITLLEQIRQDSALAYDVRGFVDDAPGKKGMAVHGVTVLGDGKALPALAGKLGLELVLIAIPTASGRQMTKILEECHAANLPYKTVPSLVEIIKGNDLARQIRSVAVEDLLGRSPARLEHDRIAGTIRGRTILVTGAAGSIGSELCRQIARFQPKAIVAYEIAESPLFHLQRELAHAFPHIQFHAEIGSVQNSQRLNEVFGQFQPAIVYHAAAYKHVPLMESHIFEAVENNVLGTLNVALAAGIHGVEDFVMISSDKAVRPTNMMGATKRMAELVVRSVQNGGGKFVSVRFGNVLGSNGSVVPIFKEQIARGGPVTVTHPDMRRYFMTIPEACQLVLQSATMGNGGEIFVLDMGEPVRITDLARNLILLSGFRPGQDIEIEFIGTRPGEKLYEELSTFDEDTIPTGHEKIKSFAGSSIPWPEMERHLARIQRHCNSRDLSELVLTFKELIPEYNPSTQLLSRVLRPAVASKPDLGAFPFHRLAAKAD